MPEDCVLFIGPLKRREIVIVEVKTLIDQTGKNLDWATILSYSVGDIALKLHTGEWLIKEKREIIPEDHLFFAMTAVEQQTLFDLGFFRRKAVGPLAIIYIDYASQFLPTYRTHCQGIISAQSSPASKLSILREDGTKVPTIETFKYLIKLSVREYLENNGHSLWGPITFFKTQSLCQYRNILQNTFFCVILIESNFATELHASDKEFFNLLIQECILENLRLMHSNE